MAMRKIWNSNYFGTLLQRCVIAFILTLLTYNPLSGKNSVLEWYFHAENRFDPMWILILVIFAIAHIAFVVAAIKSLGRWGLTLYAALVAALLYFLVGKGYLSVSSQSMQWASVVTYACVLGVGASFAIMWRRATGQIATTDTTDLTPEEVPTHNHD